MFYEHSGYCSLTLIWSLTDAAANKQTDEQQQLLQALLSTGQNPNPRIKMWTLFKLKCFSFLFFCSSIFFHLNFPGLQEGPKGMNFLF